MAHHHPIISSTSESSSSEPARSGSKPARRPSHDLHSQHEQDSPPAGSACVEFVYRVYEDGRRERFATLLLPTTDGKLVVGPRRPSGRVGVFVAQAVSEWRKVGIDPRGETRVGYRPRHR
jgi:hypothetical protein